MSKILVLLLALQLFILLFILLFIYCCCRLSSMISIYEEGNN